MKTLVVNFFAGPGAGKTTMASYLFGKFKMDNVQCELVTEFAKELTWEQRRLALSNQLYVFGEQQYRIYRLNGKVDLIFTDCPILLSYYYQKHYHGEDELLKEIVLREYNKYDNLNVLINRKKPFVQAGRNEDEATSKKIDKEMKKMLKEFNLIYMEVSGNEKGLSKLYTYLKNYLDQNNQGNV